jgi:hypothetical protein
VVSTSSPLVSARLHFGVPGIGQHGRRVSREENRALGERHARDILGDNSDPQHSLAGPQLDAVSLFLKIAVGRQGRQREKRQQRHTCSGHGSPLQYNAPLNSSVWGMLQLAQASEARPEPASTPPNKFLRLR